MDTKKLLMIALAAGSLSLFAACGDDNGNGGGDGGEDECSLDEAPPCDLGEDINPTATCIDDVAEEEPENFRVTSIAIPAASAPIGFDLDCFDTSSTDEFGCGKPDKGDGDELVGIDNALASLNVALGALDIDLNGEISGGIADGYTGTIRFNVVVTGWNGDADDDCVVLGLESYDLESGTWVTAAESVAGVVEGGVLKAVVDSLPLVIPFSDDESDDVVILAVNVEGARVELPLAESGIEGGVIGGHVIWEREGSTQDLSSLVEQVINNLDSSVTFEQAAGIIRNQLDMYVEGESETPCDCDAISVGLEIDAEPEAPPV